MGSQENVIESITLRIDGMDCLEEVKLIERKLNSLEGIDGFDINLGAGSVQVSYDPSRTSVQEIIRSISETGMSCSKSKNQRSHSTWWRDKQQLALYSSGTITLFSFVLMFLGVQEIITNALFGVAVLVGVYFPARKAIIALLNLVATIHLLMLIGATGAVLLGMWYEAAILIFVYSLGDVLESYAVDKARGAIRSLVELVPKKALVRKDDSEIVMSTEEIVVGDIVIVRPGERIPVDGKVYQGNSYVDQAAITGEPVPVGKKIGDEVFAGTINQNGSLEVRVDKLVSETMLSKIICSVEEAQASRTSYQRFSDNFARFYTPAMFVLGVFIAVVPPLFFGGDWQTFILRGLVVFVVSCSCGLALSVPVAVVAAMANAARNGTVYKGGAYLEVVDKVKAIAFDKTGTLTIGRPEVTDVKVFNGSSEHDLLGLAGRIESRSGHPLATAIVRKSKENNAYSDLPAEDFEEIAGLGVSATVNGERFLIGNQRQLNGNGVSTSQYQGIIELLEDQGKTVVLISSGSILVGLIAIADNVRPGAKEALQRLKHDGLRTVMLTGDNERSARAIATQVGIDEYHSQLLPIDKVSVVKSLKEKYGTVAMVGDGINDAPAMAASDVGIAMGAAGTDIAIEAGDVVLMSDDLSKLNYLRELSSRAVATIQQNIWFSLINIAFMVGAALLGYLGLVSGLLLNEASAVLVILNALRLLKWKSKITANEGLEANNPALAASGAETVAVKGNL
ncbi:MAG: cation-translocating P-type ATPase [Methanomassiliicoccales archaeon]|jgi:Cd2+/Zn2+-exporting ATPase